MTLSACLQFVDELAPNSVSDGIKRRWLAEVEGMVQVELMHIPPADSACFDDATSGDTLLSAPAPYARVYWLYLLAMLRFAEGDTPRYENAAALFNAAYRDLAKYICRKGERTT